jgi:glycosyltransferase involved in cell wall biosynthesis
MSVYNDLRFLDEAVNSILAQTFEDFEFIIVDDGTGSDAVERLRMRDPRIRVVVNERNTGGAAAGNRGIAEARCDVIVRLDADDVAEPTRIERVMAELERDTELGLVGSFVTVIAEDGTSLGMQPMPETDVEIRWTILFHNPFYHPSVAFRKRSFDAAGGYAERERISYDHYLWFRMLDVCRARNIPEPLVRYRLNPSGLTGHDAKTRPRSRTHAIREELWKRLGLTYTLYDDALAADVSQFVRGAGIEPARRGPAYDVVLDTLRAFAAKTQPLVRSDEPESLHQLTRRLVARTLAEPPAAR